MRWKPKLWDRQRGRAKKQRERSFPWKALSYHRAWPTHRVKDWGNTKGEVSSCVKAPPPSEQRQKGLWSNSVYSSQSRRQGAILALETGILHQTVSRLSVANQDFLGSWMADICQEDFSLRSALQRRHRAHLRPCAHQAPGHLSCSHLGRAHNACPAKFLPLWNTWEPESKQLSPGKCTKFRASFGQYLCRATWSLSSVDQESTYSCELGQTQCGPYTKVTPHTYQWYLFMVFLPPHNTSEQVSLNKSSPSPPCQGGT